ncbi:MAG: Hpt domain-containing protein [Desulfobulbaceae bacterium]|nr:Hpt domain-containing protein [Desulfobulbaceae bacterium]MCK5341336.1 Hpt domain-containing protein [Desulfobulbaceae bacterium]
MIEELELPGIDLADALRRLNGNLDFLKEILIDFADQNHSTAIDIRNAISDKDYDLARTLCHTLKGVAGNIGAKDLFQTAQLLEKAIKTNQLNENDPLIQSLEQRLNEVLSAKNIL